ncbi:contractile injection system protein, VgrG/Pvc8 family, partial [Alteraurantiacibacter buctensis]
TLQNADGLLAMPGSGRRLSLALGWRVGGEDALPGLVDKGSYVVDEVSASGPPDQITITARSADLARGYRRRRTRSWTDTTLGSVLGQIASDHGGSARVESALANRPIIAIEQEGKSDMAFVRDLGRRYDAVATWKGGVLLFLPAGGGASASGTPLGSAVITRQHGNQWTFTSADRDTSDGVQAQWHDAEAGRRRTVSVGSSRNRRRLPRVYATQDEARQAAEAALSRDARSAWKFSYALAVADPELQPEMRVTLQGWNSTIGGIAWSVDSVETSYGPGGLTQRIELEGAAQ